MIGDFNLTIENNALENFMSAFDFASLIKEPTCYQSENPRCIDLILTNKKEFMKNSKTFEVGISDHHKFIVTRLRSQFSKGNPRTKLYRGYKLFDIDAFKRDLNNKIVINRDCSSNYSKFHENFVTTLNIHAPLKKKTLRFNDHPFMTKDLRKAIMHRSKLKNIHNKKRTTDTWDNYKKQRNFCVSLLRKTKQNFFQNLDTTNIRDSRSFWRTIKPYFNANGSSLNKMMLKENERLVTDEKKIAEIMNSYFVNITNNLPLKIDAESEIEEPSLSSQSPSQNFEDHKSVKKINETFDKNRNFSFQEVNEGQVRTIISKLDCSKAIPNGDIPVNILKSAIDIHINVLTNLINISFRNNSFPDYLKLG